MVDDPSKAATQPSSNVIHRDIVSSFCAGACDDVQVTLDATGKVIAVEGGCNVARHRFESGSGDTEPPARIDQQPSSLDEAIERAVEILTHARAPLIFGLEHLTCEAQSLAVSLADRLGATIDTPASALAGNRGTALEQVGESACTLGDMRDRADLILLWDLFTCRIPCQLYDRLLDAPAGSFFRQGRSDQTVVILDERRRRSASEDLADEAKIKARASEVLTINEQSSYEAICVLRALIKRLPLDPKCVLETGLELEQWKGLAERLRCCRYGVIVWRAYDLHVERSLGRLIIELNDVGRFAGLSVNKSGMNSVGAEQVLAWRTGYPCAVNFAAGFPRYKPGESSDSAVLARGEADAAVLFGFPNDVVLDDLETFASHHPTIEIAAEPEPVVSPAVFIRTAQPGLHSAGTIFRCDGVPLPLRSIVPTVLPAAELVLKQLLTALDRSQQITHAKAQRRKGER